MKDELTRAIRLHSDGRLEEARAIYLEILQQSPRNPDALHFLGVLSHQCGDSDAAVELIGQALDISPGYADAHKNLGNVFHESGRAQDAEGCYRTAIGLDANDAEAWSNLCAALKVLNRGIEAVDAGLKSVTLAPGNAAGWYNLACALKKSGQLDEAVAAYLRAIRLHRGLAAAHQGLAQTIHLLDRQGRVTPATLEERAHAYRQWLKDEPDNPVGQFMLAACEGDSAITRAPEEYVRNLFDAFASGFEHNLAQLEYRVPELIRTRLERVLNGPSGDLHVLDAGCGTGLCGPVLRPYAARLTGVDLSGGMLEKARRRCAYDTLAEAELTAWLGQHAGSFDLIVSADTLCYFGDLAEVTGAAARALKSGGRLIFSLELLATLTPQGFRLTPFGRYCHSPKYVEDCLTQVGLEMTGMQRETLRLESGEPVEGLLVDARRVAG